MSNQKRNNAFDDKIQRSMNRRLTAYSATKHLLVLVIAILISSISFSQINYEQEITWDKLQKRDYDGADYYVISPVNVNFSLNDQMLPEIHELISINTHNTDVESIIIDSRFEVLSADEKDKINNLSLIKNQLKINSSIQYIRKKAFIEISILPFRKNPSTGELEKLTYIKLDLKPSGVKKARSSSLKAQANSVLASGKWVKIAVDKNGIYQLTSDELKDMGFNSPANVKVFGNLGGLLPLQNNVASWDDLEEIAIQRNNDHILFYAKGPDKWNYNATTEMYIQENHIYSDNSFYFLTEDVGIGKSILNAPSPAGAAKLTVTAFDDYFFYEPEDTNLIKSGRQWYGDEFNVLESRDYQFNFPNRTSNEELRIKASVIARSSLASSFDILSNGTTVEYIPNITQVSFGENNTFANSKILTSSFSSAGDNLTITLKYNKPTSSAKAWLNYLTLNARRNLSFTGSQMSFRDVRSVSSGQIAEFNITNCNSAVQVWNVTDPLNNTKISTSLNGSKLSFTVATDSIQEFISFNGSSYLTPTVVGLVENQNIHGNSIPDLTIIVPPRFLQYAEELAKLHEDNDGMNVLLVTNKQVFNEFSSGMPDIAAFRNMMRMFYNRASTESELPKYLMFFGDGSYNNKTSAGNIDLLMTYQTANSLNPISSICTDDFFGYLDETEGDITGKVDIGIGRIPVSTDAQARNAVDKIKHYLSASTYGDWRNIVSFIGDDPDSPNYNVHTELSEEICSFINTDFPSFNIDKIYLDAYPQETNASGERYPDAEIAINNRINKGALLINYAGHGNEIGLSHERVITVDDILGWDNYDRLPMFVTATCEFCRFDDYGRTSGGELIFLNSQGGGIALLTTSRSVFHSSLNKNFYETALSKDANNEFRTIGNIVMETKNNSGGSGDTNTKKFVLIGDPALKLALPEYSIKTDSINGHEILNYTDTIRALSFVTISGHIQNANGSIMSDFNGEIHPTIYDKNKTLYTLGNEGNNPFPYSSQTNIVYKGKASVENGRFAYSFIVPKDIAYDFGYGKISYYANNTELDATGYSRNIIIGGASNTNYSDSDGPEIELYINSDDFIYGGMTDENPTILAYFKDKSGINTVGNGIGHDIAIVIDNNANNNHILNDYYEADINSYESGKLEYKLSNMSSGEHFLRLKVWDILNNSSVDSIAFYVEESAEAAINQLFNYPNPFTENTAFYFEHNQSNTSIDVQIQIFSVAGKLVKTLEANLFADGYRVGPLDWDGKDDFGNDIGRGVYVYKLNMRTETGKQIDKIEKLVILK